MKYVTNILLVVDNPSLGSHGLPRATALAQRHGATLTLIHAFDSYAHDVVGSLPEPDAAELEQLEYEAGLRALEEMAAEPRAAGIDVRTYVRVGNPFIEVTREVLRNGYDLVMKETSPDRIAGSRLFTSQEMHLLRKCPSPLLLLTPTGKTRFGVVMAAIDPAPSHEERQELNQRIIELAMEVAADEQAILHVAHVWRLRSERSLDLMRRTLSEGYVRRLVEEERLRRTALVEELVAPYRGGAVQLSVEMVEGQPSRVLPALTRRLRVDLLVMGTVARSGIPGLIIGTTAENVLDDVTCSVLGVKPRGFLTPVRLPDMEVRGGADKPQPLRRLENATVSPVCGRIR
ncbi:MAG: universal stress protein [Gemmatimonadaceae bacterium]